MISRLRQWFKTKASYEKSLVKLKNTLYALDRDHACDEMDVYLRTYSQIIWDKNRQENVALDQVREALDKIQEENEDLKQQIISLAASGITLKNELDELKREV